MTDLVLEGLDGSNPLGFLSALGTLAVAHAAGESGARLAWERRGRWVPVVRDTRAADRASFAALLVPALRGAEVTREAEADLERARASFEKAKKAANDAAQAIKGRKLKGEDRRAALDRTLAPLIAERDRRRQDWLAALARAVPRPELGLGKHLDCTPDEFREHGAAFLGLGGWRDREALDLLAAFGSDAAVGERSRSERIEPTPFCFTSGSGHQYFLDTVRQLLPRVSAQRVEDSLFHPWVYRDDGLSMRWDPVEDRRYALMDTDPGPLGARTVWMANLLAYRGLVLFPSAPRGRRLETTAWTGRDGEPTFTWPLWTVPLGPEVIRSLLQLREVVADPPDGATLRARGIAALYRSRRIKVGSGANYKVNFTPARAVWAD
jgi:hypothetical protein